MKDEYISKIINKDKIKVLSENINSINNSSLASETLLSISRYICNKYKITLDFYITEEEEINKRNLIVDKIDLEILKIKQEIIDGVDKIFL